MTFVNITRTKPECVLSHVYCHTGTGNKEAIKFPTPVLAWYFIGHCFGARAQNDNFSPILGVAMLRNIFISY